MPNNKWTKTATSASLAILGVTQLNNKADAKIVLGGSNVTQSGNGFTTWTLDQVSGYGAHARAGIINFTGMVPAAYGSTGVAIVTYGGGTLGGVIDGNAVFRSARLLGRIPDPGGNPKTGYFGFRDTKGGTGIYGWAEWTLSSTKTLTLNEWYYNDTPGASIKVGDKGTSTAVPFDFNPLEGAALGVPIFIGLRQLKRRKAKLNSIVSVKGKEKIHPLALLGMGAAGVLKWRAQKDKDAA
jgi:hypothetical protein